MSQKLYITDLLAPTFLHPDNTGRHYRPEGDRAPRRTWRGDASEMILVGFENGSNDPVAYLVYDQVEARTLWYELQSAGPDREPITIGWRPMSELDGLKQSQKIEGDFVRDLLSFAPDYANKHGNQFVELRPRPPIGAAFFVTDSVVGQTGVLGVQTTCLSPAAVSFVTSKAACHQFLNSFTGLSDASRAMTQGIIDRSPLPPKREVPSVEFKSDFLRSWMMALHFAHREIWKP